MLAALHHPRRVASLTLVATTPGDTDLPPMSDELLGYVDKGGPDLSDTGAVVEFIVGLIRAYSGGSPYFDEDAVRALAGRDLARSTVDIASCLTNHFAIDLGDPSGKGLDEITVPTLVVHGERDPVFPLGHGLALRQAIRGAELLVMPRAGHELPPPLWDLVVPALLEHTARA